MLTRRTLLASSAATLAAPAVIPEARAATPKGVAVMAKQIDDIVSFDPAESYEFTNNEVDANCYRRLVTPEPGGRDEDRRRPGGEMGGQQGRPDLHLPPAPRRACSTAASRSPRTTRRSACSAW